MNHFIVCCKIKFSHEENKNNEKYSDSYYRVLKLRRNTVSCLHRYYTFPSVNDKKFVNDRFSILSFFFFFFLQIDDSSLPERDAAIHVESRANSSHHPSNHHYHKYSLSLLYFFSRSFTRTFSLSLSHFIIFTRSLDSFVLLVVFSPYADNTLTGHTSSVNSDLPHSAHHH